MNLTTGDKIGIGVGAALAAFIGYEIWKNSKTGIPDYSATQHKLIYGTSYVNAVDSAGGFDTTLTQNGSLTTYRVFIEGTYVNNVFTPNGKVYSYQAIPGVSTAGSTVSSTGGFYTTVSAITTAGYSFHGLTATQAAA